METVKLFQVRKNASNERETVKAASNEREKRP
jgi:hypothetical protein